MFQKQYNRISLHSNKYFFVKISKHEMYVDENSCISIVKNILDEKYKAKEITLFRSYDASPGTTFIEGSLEHVILDKMTKEFV